MDIYYPKDIAVSHGKVRHRRPRARSLVVGLDGGPDRVEASAYAHTHMHTRADAV